MGITDMFKTKQFKSDIEKLSAENEYLKSLLSPEMLQANLLHEEIIRLNNEKTQIIASITAAQRECEKLNRTIDSLNTSIKTKQKYLVILDDEALYQDFGLYTPVYNLMNSEAYKDKLSVVRERQKVMIKNNTAVDFPTNFTYNNSLAQGKKLVADNVKQILRAFNNECEAIIDKVKFNNVESIRKRIIKSCEDLNKLNSKMHISIKPSYLDLKLQEMNLCYEYAMKKQEEKEEAKRIREEQREAQKLQREIDEARKKSEKERAHYNNALQHILEQIKHASDLEKELLENRRTEIENQLSTIEDELRQIDYRQANQKAGYVYVISNIGSFGKDIYKIGMTRRLEPTERVDELGDASVPFSFDIHAMIFSDDAPALEAALHRAFDSKKVNMVNTRREFFHVTLEEIEAVVRQNYDKTVEFVKVPRAEQYRESQMIRRGLGISDLVRQEMEITETIPQKSKTAPQAGQQSISRPLRTYSPQEILYTKWGTYEMPNPYKVNLTRGPRKDLKKIKV